MKKLVLIISILILAGCCDNNIGACNSPQTPIAYFVEGVMILCFLIVVVLIVISIIYKIKTDRYFMDLEEYGFASVLIWLLLIAIWAVVYFGFNGIVLLKYFGVA